jgi:hypothetical protein
MSLIPKINREALLWIPVVEGKKSGAVEMQPFSKKENRMKTVMSR